MNYCINCDYFIKKRKQQVVGSIELIEYDHCGYYLHQITREPKRCIDVRPDNVYNMDMEYPECKAYKETEN